MSDLHGRGSSDGRVAAVSLSTGERWSRNNASRSVGLLPVASDPSGGDGERREGGAVEPMRDEENIAHFFGETVYAMVRGSCLWPGLQT